MESEKTGPLNSCEKETWHIFQWGCKQPGPLMTTGVLFDGDAGPKLIGSTHLYLRGVYKAQDAT